MTQFSNLHLPILRNIWKKWGQWLAPYFGVDKILPYTYLGLLNDQQLISLLKSEDESLFQTLPLVGILAAVEYTISYGSRDGKVNE